MTTPLDPLSLREVCFRRAAGRPCATPARPGAGVPGPGAADSRRPASSWRAAGSAGAPGASGAGGEGAGPGLGRPGAGVGRPCARTAASPPGGRPVAADGWPSWGAGRGPRRGLRVGLLAALLLGAPAAGAFPVKPVELVVPTPPGGGTDIATRLLAEATEPFLGQKLVVLNKPGGGGTVGVSAVTQAKPDGYTLASVWNAPMTMTPHVLPVPYTPEDYTPVTQTTAAPLVFCTKPDFPAATGREFVEALRKNPGKYTYGTDGVGGTVQLAAERIFRTQGVQARPVPFGGAGETLKAFLGGHVDIYGGSIPPVLPHVGAGKAKCLLLTSRERNEALPQAAGLQDLGVPQAATVLWRGIIAPRGVPADVLAVLEKAFRQGVQAPRFRDAMRQRGEDVVGGSPAEFAELIRSEYQAFGQIVRDLGLGKK